MAKSIDRGMANVLGFPDQKPDYFSVMAESAMQMNHLRTARMNMTELRKSAVMTDLVFLCRRKGHSLSSLAGIHAHRVVLATSSPLFAEKDITLKEVDLQDTDQHIVEAVLDFVYLGNIPSLHKYTDLINMTLTAYRLQIIRLYSTCLGRLLVRLNVCNASEVLNLAKLCGDTSVVNKIIHYLGTHLPTSFRASTYQQLDLTTLQDVINHYLKEVKECNKDLNNVSQLIYSWADHDPTNRLRQVSNLLQMFKIDSFVLAKSLQRKLQVSDVTSKDTEDSSYISNFSVISSPRSIQGHQSPCVGPSSSEMKVLTSNMSSSTPRKISPKGNAIPDVEADVNKQSRESSTTKFQGKNISKAPNDCKNSNQPDTAIQNSDSSKPPKVLPRTKIFASLKSPRLTPEQIKMLKFLAPTKKLLESSRSDPTSSPEKQNLDDTTVTDSDLEEATAEQSSQDSTDFDRQATSSRKRLSSPSPRLSQLTNTSNENKDGNCDPSAEGDFTTPRSPELPQYQGNVVSSKKLRCARDNFDLESLSPRDANWKVINRQKLCEALKTPINCSAQAKHRASASTPALPDTKPSFIVLWFSKKSYHYCLQKFALDLEKWTQTKILFKELEAFEDAAITIGFNTLFLVGGLNSNGQVVGSTIGISLIQYNTVNYPPMRLTRAKSTAVFLQGLVVVIGGESKYGRPVGYVEKLNPETNNWFSVSSLRKPRCSCQAVVTREANIIVLGGWDMEGCLLSCELYDSFTNSWTEILSLPSFFLMSEPKVFLHENNIFVVPVVGPSLPALFDLKKEVWLAPTSSSGTPPTKAKCMAVFGDQLFIMDYRLAVYTYYLHSHHWEKVSPSRIECNSGCHVIFYDDPRRETETLSTLSDEDEFSDGKAEGS